MEFEFVIPELRAELLRGGRVKQYTVAELLSPALLRAPLDEFQSVFRTQGPLAILDHFDVLYGVLCHFKSLDASLQEQTLDLVMKVVSQHSSILPSVLGSSPPAPLLRQQHLNTLKMGCYLLTQLVEAFEERGARMQTLNLAAGGKARRPKASSLSVDWETDRVSSLQHLTQLLQLDLWPLGPPDAALTRIVTRCCYRLLESPAVVHVKNKPVREAVAHLLALMIKRYNHMLGATLNIIQLLQHFEHVAPALVHIVSIWANEYGLKTIVGEILREIRLTVDNSGGSETLGVRAIAAFLSELAEEIPTAILPNVSLILDLLNKESAALRSGVLCCLSHMVCRSLSGPGLDADSRRLRDAFLDLLSQHLHDSNALVRSRALQLLTAVVRGKALPLKRFQPLVTLATGRLCDKAVNVCKNAVNLLAAILANNPFCGRLSIDELSLSHQKELKKLLVLRAERGTVPGVPLTPHEEWEAILPELLPALQATLEDGETEEQEGETETEGETAVRGEIGDTPQALCEEVRTLLKAARYRQASLLALEGLSSFPDAFPFRTPTSDPQDGEGVTDDETSLLRILQACLRGAGTEQEEEGDSKVPEPEADEGTSELARQEVLVQYLHDTLTFGEAIQSAIEIIGKLLASKNPSVVQDAIHFFVSIAEFDVPGSMAGMKQMLPLVCSKEPGVREAVVDAYRQLYLNPNGKRPKPLVLVQNLTALIFDASVERIKCLEELVSEFVRQQEVEGSVIQLLWERFTGKVAVTADERRAAVILLGMAARGEAEIVGSNLETLFTVGLGPRAGENYQLARDVCMTIGKITHTKKGLPGQREASFRLPSDHPLFSSISTAITEGFSTPSLGWRPFAEAALSLVYRLAETPDRLSGRLLVQCSRLLLSPHPVSASSPPGSPQSNGTTGQVPSHLLANLVCLVGHVALQQVVHLEQSVAPEMQRRRLEREQRSSKQRTANTSKRGSVSAMEEELGLVEGSVEDTEADLVRRICDGELLEEGQLLAAFVPLVVRLCSNPGAYEDCDLATISCLALCKLTFVSYDFCERNLRLLFTLLEKSPTPTIRCNTMVALGDLCFRFPNLLEPWSPSLYSRLRDPSRSVRRTALIVMTHLILRDMVKVKGQISEIAVLLVDEDEEISLLARSFFNELSCKGNAVYNLLPDIISRLSDAECGIEEEPFHAVMRLTFGYITKDRQTESLVEKLCQRFRTATLDRQYRDLAFCLGLLPASERGLRKIQDNFDCISDKLQQDYVYQQFQNLVGRLRRALRPELKVLVDEFEQRISRCHSRGLDEGDSTDVKPAQPPKAVGKGTAGKKMSSTAVVSATPRVGRRNKPRRKVCVDFSSDEDDDEDDEDAAVMDCDTPVLSPIRRSGQRRGPRARK